MPVFWQSAYFTLTTLYVVFADCLFQIIVPLITSTDFGNLEFDTCGGIYSIDSNAKHTLLIIS